MSNALEVLARAKGEMLHLPPEAFEPAPAAAPVDQVSLTSINQVISELSNVNVTEHVQRLATAVIPSNQETLIARVRDVLLVLAAIIAYLLVHSIYRAYRRTKAPKHRPVPIVYDAQMRLLAQAHNKAH